MVLASLPVLPYHTSMYTQCAGLCLMGFIGWRDRQQQWSGTVTKPNRKQASQPRFHPNACDPASGWMYRSKVGTYVHTSHHISFIHPKQSWLMAYPVLPPTHPSTGKALHPNPTSFGPGARKRSPGNSQRPSPCLAEPGPGKVILSLAGNSVGWAVGRLGGD